MKRRDFLKALLGGAVAAVVLPEAVKAEAEVLRFNPRGYEIPFSYGNPPHGLKYLINDGTRTMKGIDTRNWITDPLCPEDRIYAIDFKQLSVAPIPPLK